MVERFDGLTVKQLTIVDDAERVRAMISCSEGDGRPYLQLLDLAGCPRLELSLDADGSPHIALFSAKSVLQGSFGLSAADGGAGVTLWSENGRFFKVAGVSNGGVEDDQGKAIFDESREP
ncbi:hypothetical protein [Lacipirellula limnantheis]|uniref:Uncharacterized protein n=1 Tax=Lacipirellula limnantheis TaxID=2528024 RepID=A0A517U1U5_9BACT|nr:hypothetical protein [Lacipirellula limnantheis]QDT74583.1 hypothetical protein I41_37800 [Lacipirellula limnantheis]